MASWLIAFCSSLAISSSWIALCSSLRVASSSRSSSAMRERSSAGSIRLHGMDSCAHRNRTAAITRLRACGYRVCVLPARLLDCRPELVAQALARHGEKIAAGLARSYPQIAVGRPRVIEALVLAVDQDRSRRIGL